MWILRFALILPQLGSNKINTLLNNALSFICFMSLCLMALKTHSQNLSITLGMFSCFGICKSTSLYGGIKRAAPLYHCSTCSNLDLSTKGWGLVFCCFFFLPTKEGNQSHAFFSQEELPPVNKQLKTELQAPAAWILFCKETTGKTKQGEKHPVSPLHFTCTLEAKWTRQCRTGDVLLEQYSCLTVL